MNDLSRVSYTLLMMVHSDPARSTLGIDEIPSNFFGTVFAAQNYFGSILRLSTIPRLS
jgi:hypothetical protein